MTDLRVVPAALMVWVALTGVSYAANKIAVTCSGTETNGFKEWPANPKSIITDLDRGTVTMRLTEEGVFPITEVRENYITFGSGDVFQSHQTEVRGSIDRVSGHVTVSVYPGLGQAITYDLTCKPAKPLF
jgi:hypothetical protein